MKKFVVAVVLCLSASFSPVNAQLAVNGTAAMNGAGTVTSANIVPAATTVALSTTMYKGTLATMAVQIISLNGTVLLGNGFVDPDLLNKIKGASCTYVPGTTTTNHKASCTK
jgi:hypothetical protein